MSRFNLIDEPWIPVRLPEGSRDLGIKETLLRAKEILAIEDVSPLVVASIHRFLLAVLYRALEGPADINQAQAFFESGLPTGRISAYLEQWRDRFWLFDQHYPFGQIPSFQPKIWRAWTVLAAEHNADNAKVLFDHTDVGAPGTISPKAAAKWILATQTFAVSCGKSELAHTGTAPSATAAMAIPTGQNLHDTLLFGLIPQSREILATDLPLWERTPESVSSLSAGVGRASAGLADRYTWRTRSILLRPSDASVAVGSLAFASGVDCTRTEQRDPMLGYRIDEKKGMLPIQLRDRGLWRDFDSFLPDDGTLSPTSVQHAVSLARKDKARFPRSMMVLGQSNNKAKIEYWRMERFALPEAMANDTSIRSEIRAYLDLAEAVEKALWFSCSSFARHVLGRGERTPDTKDIKAFVSQMVPIPYYWSSVETRFHSLLHRYCKHEDRDEIALAWWKDLRTVLKEAWGLHCASVTPGDAWAIRAMVKAERPVERKLQEMSEEINKYQSLEGP